MQQLQQLQQLSLQGLANEINLVFEDLKAKESYIQILKIINRQYEIERNLDKYKTIERRGNKIRIRGGANKSYHCSTI